MLVGNLKTLQPAMAARWGIDVEQGLRARAHGRGRRRT